MRTIEILLFSELFVGVPAGPLGAQMPTPAGSSRADSAFQRKDWGTAATLYATVVTTDSANGAGWFRLGASQEQLGRLREAAGAYRHAASLGFQQLAAELRLSRVYARLGDRDTALVHLRVAAGLGVAPAILENEPALAPVRAMPEYAAIRATAEAARYPCRAVHTFDFWAGTFDVSSWALPNSPPTGVARNARRYDGCVIVEEFSTGGGSTNGMSMSFYDVNRGVWRMVWNDDGNGSNDFEGSYRDGAMRFLGWVLDGAGHRILASNTLVNVAADTVHQTYATSADSGKTWTVRSDGRYVRRPKTDAQ